LSLSLVLGACDDDDRGGGGLDATVSPDVPVDVSPDVAGRFPVDPPAGYTLHDLGDLATLDGETEDFTLEVPAGAVSLHLTLVSHPGVTPVLLGAAGPDGVWVVTDELASDVSPDAIAAADAVNGGFGWLHLSANKSVGLPRATTVLIPNTPRVALTPGRWTFRVGAFDADLEVETRTWVLTPFDTRVRVAALVRTTPAPSAGTVDLVLSFDPSSGLDAATARSDADLQASFAVLDAALAEVGLAVGAVTYRDVSLTHATIALRPPACSLGDDIARLFDEAPSPRADAVHVVFIGRFTCPILGGAIDLGEQIGALSIGAPGIPFATKGGIITSTFAKPTYPADWSEILAHEVGHYLGLFHTRESNGAVDNIADTSEDEEGAKANLMYFNVTLSTATTLTDDQGAIVRLSPLVHPVAP